VTIKNHFNVLKALCRKASKDKKIDFSYSAIENFEQKKNKTNEDEEEGKQVVLTEDEVQKIYEYKSDNDKINEVKDIFVLQCELGQRIGDMSKFFCGEYKKDTEFNTVSIIQQKKNKTAIIPLFPLGEKILKKYEGGLKHTDDLNKRSTQNYINKHIKQICKEVGINDMRKYDIQEGLTVNSYRKPRCELIHTHTARHTFITNMCLRGVPENELIIATGHTDETMIKKVYKHLTPKDKSKIVGKWRNIGKSEGTTITNDEISKAAEDFKGAVLKAEREKRKKEVSEITDYVNKDISRMQEEAIKISELIKKSSL
jgi:integrase